jgi:membrane dipeptidase
VCPIYAADRPDPPRSARAALAAYDRLLEENAGQVFPVRSRADLERVGSGPIGLMLSFEGVEALGDDPDAFGEWWDRGVRMVGLTHNPLNAFAGGVDSPELGLTDRGRALVDVLVERSVVVDLAHASERTFLDVLEHAPGANVVVTHACCRALEDHIRNLSDDQLRALAERDGVLGMMALRLVVGGDADIERLVDHVDHAAGIMGVEHVGIGADVIDQVLQTEIAAGIPQIPMTLQALEAGGGVLGLRDLRGPGDYPALVEGLRARGYDGGRLDAILHGNFLRVFRRALPE